MIVSGKKPYKMPAMTWLTRIFLKFIDKNDIKLECPGDLRNAVQLFAKSVEYHLLMEWEEDDA